MHMWYVISQKDLVLYLLDARAMPYFCPEVMTITDLEEEIKICRENMWHNCHFEFYSPTQQPEPQQLK